MLYAALVLSLTLADPDGLIPTDVTLRAEALVSGRLGSAGVSVVWARYGAVTIWVLPLRKDDVLGYWAGDRAWLLAPEINEWGKDDLANAYATVIIHELLHGLGCGHGKGIMRQENPEWSESDVAVVSSCVGAR